MISKSAQLTKTALLQCLLTIMAGLTISCSESQQQLITIADARKHPAAYTDTGIVGDSVGDILTFDQPLLNENMTEIGVNSGTCIRTHVAHSFQCQWTLTFNSGSIQVAGREHDAGSSVLSIIGGTGIYSGIKGEMSSTNNDDGTFTQTLRYYLQKQE